MTRQKNQAIKCSKGISPILAVSCNFIFALFILHSINTPKTPKFCANTRKLFPHLKLEPHFSCPEKSLRCDSKTVGMEYSRTSFRTILWIILLFSAFNRKPIIVRGCPSVTNTSSEREAQLHTASTKATY